MEVRDKSAMLILTSHLFEIVCLFCFSPWLPSNELTCVEAFRDFPVSTFSLRVRVLKITDKSNNTSESGFPVVSGDSNPGRHAFIAGAFTY